MVSMVLQAVGGYFFGPIGAAIGGTIGSIIESSSTKIEGTRYSINDTSQSSAYGQSIPIVYGTIRLPGNILWMDTIKERSNSTGGKGGPEVTSYSYTCSFAVGLCEGTITSISKVWADGLLIYDPTNLELASLPITIYTGTDTQQVDPTIESIIGINNSPAYRGQAYIVFTDWDITKYGSRIPNLTFECFNPPVYLNTILADILTNKVDIINYSIDTDLTNILIKGYSFNTGGRVDARSIIQELITAYQFDTIEYGGSLKFIKRGKESMVTISTNEVIFNE